MLQPFRLNSTEKVETKPSPSVCVVERALAASSCCQKVSLLRMRRFCYARLGRESHWMVRCIWNGGLITQATEPPLIKAAGSIYLP